MMKYLEGSPSIHLSEHIKTYWSLEFDQRGGNQAPQPIVPDGCIEIVFNLADRFKRFHADGSVEVQPASLVAGQIQERIFIGPTGRVRLFGIRFKPAGAGAFFDFEMKEVTDRIEPLSTFWGTTAMELEERLWKAPSFDRQVGVVESYLQGRLKRPSILGPAFHNCIEAILVTSGTRKVGEISRHFGMSERELERKFNRLVGLSPKTFSRIVRFQAVLQSISLSAPTNILDTTYHFGYYDQSHLIKDFLRFSGMNPSDYFERTAGITDLFIDAR